MLDVADNSGARKLQNHLQLACAGVVGDIEHCSHLY
jgi:hypothetical protein